MRIKSKATILSMPSRFGKVPFSILSLVSRVEASLWIMTDMKSPMIKQLPYERITLLISPWRW